MSRIHEALKRAEMERTATHSVAGGGVPLEPQAVAASTAETGGAAADKLESKPTVIAKQADHLDFGKLQMECAADATWNPEPTSDVFNPAHGGHGAEQFRTLRSRLYQLRGSHPLRMLLVTEPNGRGRQDIRDEQPACDRAARQSERRVLVIDADLRRPRLHTVFGAAAAPGLTDYLRGAAEEASIIQHGGTGNLCLIPSGTRVNDPSELLSNGRMKTLLDRVGPAFDWVIIDSPPCLPVADAGIIAHWCDGVLLVVRAGFTPSAAALKSRQELKQRNVVGVVLNAVTEDTQAYGPLLWLRSTGIRSEGFEINDELSRRRLKC